MGDGVPVGMICEVVMNNGLPGALVKVVSEADRVMSRKMDKKTGMSVGPENYFYGQLVELYDLTDYFSGNSGREFNPKLLEAGQQYRVALCKLKALGFYAKDKTVGSTYDH